jgi:GT2 family glycosyltransferase
LPLALIGHLDGLDGPYLCGWAADGGSEASCLVEVFSPDGDLVAKGRASHRREDLRGVTGGLTDIGFRILLDPLPAHPLLHVRVGGVAVPGSPIHLGDGQFFGAMGVRDGIVQGSVTQAIATAPPPQVRIEDQYGRVLFDGLASLQPGRRSKAPAAASFDFMLPPAAFGFEELGLTAFANNVPFARCLAAARLAGYLDELSETACRGWLYSPDVPQRPFEIEVLVGGVSVASGRYDIVREDLAAEHPLAVKRGFDLALKRPEHDSAALTPVSIRLAGSSRELFGGPFLFGERSALIATARRASALLRAGALPPAERCVVQRSLADAMEQARRTPAFYRQRCAATPALPAPLLPACTRRFNIIIPVYKGIDVTQACIDSVLATYDAQRDAVILVNDRSPDDGMAEMLVQYAFQPGVQILTNPQNLGFVGSVNRALGFSRLGHAVLLNSDTRVFPGAWDEIERILQADAAIGTVTALSNNATIFSYPHPKLVDGLKLADMDWHEIAAEALRANAGKVVDVPTGHGFCMAVRREVLDDVGHLDPRFGRGYGEENDLCMRAADRGWRNVAACGVFVEHRESVSFGDSKKALLDTNMRQLNALYPEYTPTVMAYERQDGLRAARWALDRERLRRARAAGQAVALVVQNWLDGGTKTAIADIEAAYGYGGRTRMTLSCRADGFRVLECAEPVVRAVFAPDEDAALFAMLGDAGTDLVLVHQLLGYTAGFIRQLGQWAAPRQLTFYMHDFYALCPRVTMLNAVGRFCGAARSDLCARCVDMDGAHAASRLTELAPAEHRSIFRKFLGQCTDIIAPSHDTVSWARKVFADIEITAESHPQVGMAWSRQEGGRANQIVLLGAIGPHKGSGRLLELAREARLTHPELHFHVIGYTNIDTALEALGNVSISGPYEPDTLASLVRRTRARFALFLHEWPETFSYTLTEALALGLWPLVPDIGAPAERVRAAGWGSVLATPLSVGAICTAMEVFVDCVDGPEHLGISAPRARRVDEALGGHLKELAASGFEAGRIV